MNNLILILIAISLLVTTVALAGKHRAGDARMMGGGPMEAMTRHLDLSEEQQTAIRKSFEDARDQGQALREQLDAMRKQITENIRTNGYDEDQVRLTVENNIPLMVDAMMLRIGTMARIYEQLTPEQQAEVDKFMEDGGPRRWRHRGSLRATVSERARKPCRLDSLYD
jgi:Spy/CpxP family protein refolding chaperone